MTRDDWKERNLPTESTSSQQTCQEFSQPQNLPSPQPTPPPPLPLPPPHPLSKLFHILRVFLIKD